LLVLFMANNTLTKDIFKTPNGKKYFWNNS